MSTSRPLSLLDRFLRLFSDVRAGEGLRVLLLMLNVFLLLVSYYVIKTVREPLILQGGGAEWKSYASAGQALLLVGFVPAYSWFASHVSRIRLLTGVTLFFVACIGVFYGLAHAGVPHLGIAFYVWVGIFNVAIIAQFWSYANDIYDKLDGERLFPVIAIGATAGGAMGAKAAQSLFSVGVGAYEMLLVAGVLLASTVVIYQIVDRQRAGSDAAPAAAAETEELESRGGFGLVLASPYLRLIALMLILLNLVNTTGEYLLASMVQDAAAAAAAADPSVSAEQWIGSFYGSYFFWVNIGTIVLQAFVASRLVKALGIAGVLFALPIVSLSAYALIAAGAGIGVVRWAKSAENMTDYSIMNTAKAMLWLPTSRAEKYKAKQAIDTFFVRFGDVISAGLVFVGTTWLTLSLQQFALVNLVIIVVWGGVTVLVYRGYRRLGDAHAAAQSAS